MTRAMVDTLGNMEPSIDVYPDRWAPIVRNNNGQRELTSIRWGMPSSKQALNQAAANPRKEPGIARAMQRWSRRSLRSVDGGFEDVRDVFSGCCICNTSSINSSFAGAANHLVPFLNGFRNLRRWQGGEQLRSLYHRK